MAKPACSQDNQAVAKIVPDLPSDRDASGKFQTGHQIRALSEVGKRVHELRRLCFACVTNKKIRRIEEELYKLATSAADERLRLMALMTYLERAQGKPVENLNVNVAGGSSPTGQLTPDPTGQLTREDATVVQGMLEKYRANKPMPPGPSEFLAQQSAQKNLTFISSSIHL